MPRLTLFGKVDRVVRLLVGLRHPSVASALASAGFSRAEIDEGYALLRALTVADMKGAAELEPTGATALEERIAPWMRRWIPVARAALRRRHPKLESAIFAHKGQSPPGPYGTAMAFIGQWTELGDPKGRWAPEGVAARKLLASRGITKEVIDELRRLLEVRKVPWPVGNFAKAEEDLWAWYLDWSTVARAGVRDRRVLRELGFAGEGGDEGAAE